MAADLPQLGQVVLRVAMRSQCPPAPWKDNVVVSMNTSDIKLGQTGLHDTRVPLLPAP